MILGIYGSGGQGRDVFDLARAVNVKMKKWDDFVFINDFSDGLRCFYDDGFDFYPNKQEV